MRRPSRRAAAGLAAAALVLLAILAARGRRGGGETLSEPLARRPVVESVYGIGTVTASQSFQLRLAVLLHVRRLYVKEGDFVREGARLLNLDGIDYRAPFSGTVTSLPYKIGENAPAGAPAVAVVDLADRYVLLTLEQRAALRVRRGQSARLSFDGLRESVSEGVVKSVYSNEGAFLVRIDVPDLPPVVLPGMTADVAVSLAAPREALVVPVAAIADGVVRVARDGGRPRPVAVKTGIIDGEMAEIVSGDLREGDRVAILKRPR